MSESVQIVPDKIHIRSIKVLTANITASSLADGAADFEDVDVQYGVEEEFYFDEKLFRIVLSTHITAPDVSAEYSIEYVFFVENMNDYVVDGDSKQDRVVLRGILIHTLLSIAYSTSRGIILSRTQGTLLHGVILPVIDTRVLFDSAGE